MIQGWKENDGIQGIVAGLRPGPEERNRIIDKISRKIKIVTMICFAIIIIIISFAILLWVLSESSLLLLLVLLLSSLLE